MFGNPSTVLHNNHRWFIYTYVITGQYYPDGITKRSEVFALRDDFHPTLNNNANTRVQLTDDTTLQPRVGSTDWVPGGGADFLQGAALVVRRARRHRGRGRHLHGVAGVRRRRQHYRTGRQPATPAIPFPLVEATPGDPWPALADYCWAPTGDRGGL